MINTVLLIELVVVLERNRLLVPVFSICQDIATDMRKVMTGRFRLRVFDFRRGCRELTKRKGASLVKPEIPAMWTDASLCKINVNTSWLHDDVKNFPRYWSFVLGIRESPVNFPHKGQWRGALMFSLIYAWICGWVNNREAGDLRRHHAHYDVIVMLMPKRVDQQYGCRWHFYVLLRITLILFFTTPAKYKHIK